jgi:isoleucyl-tRNA synthetase
LYRGSKPVMWSVVEKTALAEAEIEYHDYVSDAIYVKFPVRHAGFGPLVSGEAVDAKLAIEALMSASVLVWTTTPWTIPGNRAVSFSSRINYGLYEVVEAPDQNWAKIGERFVFADNLIDTLSKALKVGSFKRIAKISPDDFLECDHPLKSLGYDFTVPLLDGDHVTDDAGTGFVHTAPGHGADDYNIWTKYQKDLRDRNIVTDIPTTVDADGKLTEEAPGFGGKTVITDKGEKGDANEAVITALKDAGMIVGRSRLNHQYPHSWRSKKPIIFRNTPQWFISMDYIISDEGIDLLFSHEQKIGDGHLQEKTDTLRHRALKAISETEFFPASGQNGRIG